MTLRNLSPNRPSVTFNFKRAKKLDPRITFTRASFADNLGNPINEPSSGSASQVGGSYNMFNINVPRLTDQGLLIEESRSNLFINSTWNFQNQQGTNIVITQNSTDIAAPDGTFTSTHITADSTNYLNNKFINGNALSNGKKITYSFWIYPKSIDVRLTPTPNAIRPRIGAGLSNGAGAVQPIIPLEMNKWQRISLTTTQPNDGAGQIQPSLLRDQSNVDIYVWGLQIENGAFMTSFIPCNGAQTTRAKDICTLHNIDSWGYSNRRGSFVVDADVIGSRNYSTFIAGTNKFANLEFHTFSERKILWRWITGSEVESPALSGITDPIKLSATYAIGSKSVLAVNSTAYTTSGLATSTMANTKIYLFDSEQNQELNGYFSRLSYYPARLPDTALQALTY